ncbi:MAG: hypothetical protein ACREB2_03510 [Pseudolabrys sp.]
MVLKSPILRAKIDSSRRSQHGEVANHAAARAGSLPEAASAAVDSEIRIAGAANHRFMKTLRFAPQAHQAFLRH